jgi:hypothetical protein
VKALLDGVNELEALGDGLVDAGLRFDIPAPYNMEIGLGRKDATLFEGAVTKVKFVRQKK